MEMTQEQKGNATVVTLKGNLDSAASPEVEKKLLEAIQEDVKNIVLDFSSLDYISSAGIRVLVHCHKELEKKQGRIALASVPKPIENVLYITGFLPYFKIFESVNDAINSK